MILTIKLATEETGVTRHSNKYLYNSAIVLYSTRLGNISNKRLTKDRKEIFRPTYFAGYGSIDKPGEHKQGHAMFQAGFVKVAQCRHKSS